MILTINNQEVEFKKQKAQVFTDTITIARVFEKDHYDLIKKIKNDLMFNEFISDGKISVSNYVDSRGKTQEMFLLDRDAFSYFIMSFTGDKARRWKMDYIKAFNKMENELLSSKTLTPIEHMAIANKMLLEEVEAKEKLLIQNRKVMENLKLIEYSTHDTGTTIPVEEFCKIISDVVEGSNLGRTKAYQLLRSMNFVLLRTTTPTQESMTRGYLNYVENIQDNYTTVVYTHKANKLIKLMVKHLQDNGVLNELLNYPFNPELKD